MTADRKKSSKIKGIFFGFCLFVGTLLTLAPSFFSSSIGYKLLDFYAQKNYGVKLSIEKLDLSWISSQRAKQIIATDLEGSFSTEITELENTSSLLKILFFSNSPSLFQIEGLKIDIDKVKFDERKKTTFANQRLLHHLFIKNGQIKVLEANGAITSIDQALFNLELKEGKTLIYTSGNSLSKNIEGTFEFFLSINLDEFHIDGKVNATHFPVAILDDLFGKEKLLEALVGPSLSATSNFTINEEKLSIALDVNSAYLKSSILTSEAKQAAGLQKPSFINLTLKPEGLRALSFFIKGFENLALTQQGSLQLFIDTLLIPYKNKVLDFNHLSFDARLFSSSLNFTTLDKKESLVINPSSMTFFTKNLEQKSEMSLKSSLNYNQKNPSYITASCELSDLFNATSLKKVSAKITKIPLGIFDAMFPSSLNFSELLGQTCDLYLTTQEKDNPVFSLEAFTSNLKIEPLRFQVIDSSLVLQESGHFVYKALPSSLNHLASYFGAKAEKETSLKGTIEMFSIPIKDLITFKPIDINLAALLDSEDIVLKGLKTSETLRLKRAHLALSLIHSAKLEASFETGVNFSSESLTNLLGESLQIKSEGVLEDLGSLSIPYLKTTATSSTLSTLLSVSITENLRKVSLLEPFVASLSLKSSLFNQLLNVDPTQTEFSFLTPLELTLSAPSFYIDEHQLKQLQVQGGLKCEKIKIIDKLYGKDYQITDVNGQLDANSDKKTLASSFSLDIGSVGSTFEKGSIVLDLSSIDFTFLDLDHASYKLGMLAKRVPAEIFDVAFGLNNAAATLIGNKVEALVAIESKNHESKISGAFNSDHLNFSYAFEQNPEELVLKKPISGTLQVKRDTYSALEQLFSKKALSMQTFAISSETELSFNIEKLKWHRSYSSKSNHTSTIQSFFDRLQEHVSKSLFDITLNASHLNLVCQKTHQHAYLKNLTAQCTKSEGLMPLTLTLTSDALIDPTSKEHASGHLSLLSTMQILKKENQEDVLASKFSLSLAHFPTLLVDMTFKAFDLPFLPPSVLIGKTANINFEGKFENLDGTFNLKVDSFDAKADAQGQITNKTLKLLKPLKAELVMTQELSDYFLSKMNIFISKATAPMKLLIDNRGFYIPLDPFNLRELQIRKMELDLGQFNCINQGNPEEIGSVFKLNLNKGQMINLWFAPMQMSLSGGILYVDRTEVLYNLSYEICFWGKLDLPGYYASMTLGLTEQSLRKAFGVRGLPRSFVLQLPIEGPLNNIQINKEVTATRVALLLAKTTGLSSYGGLWGGITTFLSEIANDQTMVPPATPPYPWTGKISTFEKEEELRNKVNIIK